MMDKPLPKPSHKIDNRGSNVNMDRKRERERKYYQAHREKMDAQNKAYREKHKEEIREQKRLYYQRAYVKRQFKNSRLKFMYGITLDDYELMLAKQDNKCALCKRELYVNKKNGVHIDHDHKTGRVRGLLCSECNTGIGKLGDTGESLLRAAMYVDGGLYMEMY